ncbi:MAG TPA: hypothetical protein VK196_03495 [Magnetospirillum sp.]|nr:hypothetical protein [Magnetospirillum sp.]
MKRVLLIAATAIAVSMTPVPRSWSDADTTGSIASINDFQGRYVSEWKEDFRLNVTEPIMAYGVAQCPNYNWTIDQPGNSSGKLYIRCIREGNRWRFTVSTP